MTQKVTATHSEPGSRQVRKLLVCGLNSGFSEVMGQFGNFPWNDRVNELNGWLTVDTWN